jgi:hypothetical protein
MVRSQIGSKAIMRMMSAEPIAEALGGRKAGGGWMARCPAHDDRQPSLSIRDTDDGRALVHCHAGCSQNRVIAALRSRGLWDNRQRRFAHPLPRVTADDHAGDEAKRTAAALTVWQAAMPAAGTLAETYLVAPCRARPASSTTGEAALSS